MVKFFFDCLRGVEGFIPQLVAVSLVLEVMLLAIGIYILISLYIR